MLKKAVVSFISEHGEEKTRILKIKSVNVDYEGGRVDTYYLGFASEEAQAKGAQPEVFRHSVALDLSIPTDIELLLAVSDRLWEINRRQPLIDDYSELAGDGKMISLAKSLDELGATIVEA